MTSSAEPRPAAPWWHRPIATPGRDTVLAALGLLALALFFAREALLLGRVFYLRDLHLQWYGQIETLVRVVRSGAWPLWDPLVAFGRPLLANANNQLLYPPTWLNFLLPPEHYFTLFFVVHVFLAGWGVYSLARRWGASPLAAFTGGALFCVSGPLLALGNLWNHLAATAYMPWSLWAAERFATRPRAAAALVWGALLAAPILAGSPDVSALAVGAGAAQVALRPGGRLRPAAGFGAALLFAAALSAGQLLPALDVALESSRPSASAAARAYWSVHPLVMLQTLVPLFHDAPTLDLEARRELFDGREPLLLSLYLGAGTLALALAAFLPADRRAVPGRGRLAFLLTLTGAGLLFALGPHTPLYAWLLEHLAPLRLLRYPSKAMLAVALGAALLAALGADAWRDPEAAQRRFRAQVAAPLLVLAAAAWLLGRLPHAGLAAAAAPALGHLALLAAVLGLLGAWRAHRPQHAHAVLSAVAAVAVLDPLAVHRDLNPTAPAGFYALRPAFLARLAEGGRTYVVDYSAEPDRSQRLLNRALPYLVAGRDRPPPPWSAALGMRAYPVPPVLSGWGLPDGFSRDVLGLHTPGVAWLHALLLHAEGTAAHTRLLQLGSVGHVLSLHTAGLEDLALVDSRPGPFFEPVRVWAVPDPLPRAYVVGHARRLDDAQTVQALLAPEFDPRAEVLLAGSSKEPHPSSSMAGAAPPGSARIVAGAADRVRVAARLEGTGWLVLTDTYAAGWRALVDGRPAPIERANLAFRAVRLGAGEHVVDFAYRPRGAGAGLALSLAALLAALAVCARSLRRRGEHP